MKIRLHCRGHRRASVMALVLTLGLVSNAQALLPSPREGECDASTFPPFPDHNIGPGTLKHTQIPEDPELGRFIRDRQAAIVLGKALFWDMQVGSDGRQACASCHFRAGADPRSKNQLAPGGLNIDAQVIDLGGANLQLRRDMFPLTLFSDPDDRHSQKLRSIDDVVSSQGVHSRNFTGVGRGASADDGEVRPDAVFQVQGVNTRRVEPRNTPTMINAVFNNKNFWDGRASNIFNGVNETGAADENARVLRAVNPNRIEPYKVRLDFSSLASQAVGPIVSNFEMAFFDRPLRDIGKRLVSARALALQQVHPDDSVLGPWVSSAAAHQGKGLSVRYLELIGQAFQPEWWASKRVVRVLADGELEFISKTPNDSLQANEYLLMEYNFPLFFGLAIQEYERTLVSDDAPIDRHFDSLEAGGPGVLNERQLRGMALFEAAACAACHSGPEFSNASLRVARTGFENPDFDPSFQPPEQVERMYNGNCDVIVYEQGFYNIGVRPTEEDLGAGALDRFGNPLNAADLLTADPATIPSPELLTYEYPNIADPPFQIGERTGMQGAFKIPGLRNVELTAPYFHNGGQRTLEDVIRHYNRGGDFHEHNDAFMDFEIGRLGLTQSEIDDLAAFLRTLTDERVRWQRAPFDHPQLFVADGHPGDNTLVQGREDLNGEAEDIVIEIPAVGREGGPLGPGFLEGDI